MPPQMLSDRKLTYDRVIHKIPGRYACKLEFELYGKAYAKEVECYNPVFGFALLEDWEALIVRRYENKRKVA